MRIVMMNGGLGNQLYQYVFCRYIELLSNETCFIDDSAFWGEHVEHNGYELKRIFGIKQRLLSEYFDIDVWKEMVKKKDSLKGMSIPQQLYDNGLDIVLVADARDYAFNGNSIFFQPEYFSGEILNAIGNINGNVYYHGYWVNSLFYSLIADVVKKELEFPTITNLNQNCLMYEKDITRTKSVAVHIRRGDFVTCGRSISADKYRRVIRELEEQNEEYTYFVFSDDIEWCKCHAKELGFSDRVGQRTIFVKTNLEKKDNYVDMVLMSKCKKTIYTNSSFCQWAYFLNKNEEKEVVSIY